MNGVISANIKCHHFYLLYITCILTFLFISDFITSPVHYLFFFFQSLQQRLSKTQTNFIALTETEHLNKNVKRHFTHYRHLLLTNFYATTLIRDLQEIKWVWGDYNFHDQDLDCLENNIADTFEN